ncbi:trehalose-6-phosphate synthase [Paralimibaculum aggregatum]|uniref:Trehalose-6-phosphate synthase n=1 Tax=Paralimibaculum aggregatum TaxID=3036245 RepID=A0ABQ6LP45_9RHOB|nr:trehalose-6-phosphate synthase [Limibaculum sp. NKW23]GMG82045.1 trehalose-6-phosphate synthase [Limibaculum sp. NKW23]
MSRLVVASNRVGDITGGTQSGGLVTALGDALRDGNGLWFGWSGQIVDTDDKLGLTLERQGAVTIATQALTEEDYAHYYLGYANRALWPVMHYRLDLAEFDSAALEGYREVNRRFARALAGLVSADDVIWIHDYHMIPLAAELRALGLENRMGFFLHIPFPSPEIISAVPDHAWLVDTLFAYDVIGFQTEQHVANFGRYAEETAALVTPESHPFRAARRKLKVRSYPIGIDVEAFKAMADTPEAEDRIRRLKRGSIDTHIIGVDRLDYSKGLPDRFRAYRRLLHLHPEHAKNIVLMQIAPPTREELAAYADIRMELEQLSGAINGEFGDFDWTPVRYVHRSLARDTLAALFKGSRIGLVTPLRDGMNLVAKEYVAAQDEADPGVLILSQFAGAAADLAEALIVNPYDADEVALAMHLAVGMRREERIERHSALLERVRQRDVARWRRDFLRDLRDGTGGATAAAEG